MFTDGRRQRIAPSFDVKGLLIVNRTDVDAILLGDDGEEYFAPPNVAATWPVSPTTGFLARTNGPATNGEQVRVVLDSNPAALSTSQLATLAAASGGGAGEVDLAYATAVANAAPAAVTEAAPLTWITLPAFDLDADTTVEFEFGYGRVTIPAGGGQAGASLWQMDGVAADRGRFHFALNNDAAANEDDPGGTWKIRRVVLAGVGRIFAVRVWEPAPAPTTFFAGAGGAPGGPSPAFLKARAVA